jgi:hypothetical protein
VERTIFPPLQTAEPDEGLRIGLREYFAGEAQRLRELTGETFPTWSV